MKSHVEAWKILPINLIIEYEHSPNGTIFVVYNPKDNYQWMLLATGEIKGKRILSSEADWQLGGNLLNSGAVHNAINLRE